MYLNTGEHFLTAARDRCEDGRRVRKEWCLLLTLKTKDGPLATWCKWPLEAQQDKEIASPPSFRKGCGLADTLIFAQWNSCQTSTLQHCKTINLCCFKPLNLWQFVMVTIGSEAREPGRWRVPEGHTHFSTRDVRARCWQASGHHCSSRHSCRFCLHFASRAHLGHELVAAP